MAQISVSILSCDFSSLNKEITKLNLYGADMIHIDVMDGNFVPNITIGHMIVEAIRPLSQLPFDLHLMINNPENHVNNFIKSGADIITLHPETTKDLEKIISNIKSQGIKVGIALLPTSSLETIERFKDTIDLILIMTVNPGFCNQKFMSNQLEKIKIVAKKIKNSNIKLSVDGGINLETAELAIEAGADILVSSSFVYKNIKTNISILKNL